MLLLYVAAIGIVIIGTVHSILGELRIFPRLFASDQVKPFTRSIVRWAWHLTSLAWIGFAYVLFAIAMGHTPDAVGLARIVAIVFGLTGLVAFVTTRGRHIAWPLLAVVALASWFGVR